MYGEKGLGQEILRRPKVWTHSGTVAPGSSSDFLCAVLLLPLLLSPSSSSKVKVKVKIKARIEFKI